MINIFETGKDTGDTYKLTKYNYTQNALYKHSNIMDKIINMINLRWLKKLQIKIQDTLNLKCLKIILMRNNVNEHLKNNMLIYINLMNFKQCEYNTDHYITLTIRNRSSSRIQE